MVRETGQINRDIAATRREIEDHLAELGGRVRGQFDVGTQARRNLPALLGGLAVAGLATGLMIGGRRREHRREACEERAYSRIAGEFDIP